MLELLYIQNKNLEIMSSFYRFYFLKLSEFYYEKEKIYPFHNFFPLYSKQQSNEKTKKEYFIRDSGDAPQFLDKSLAWE